ncbi:MAG: prolyl oligopeptidase family serine peptidase, partial [Planctomycetes bacterium]|nr:prolyl oligopeptidase family serine peptidase [Planctomycetota bacterium]
KIGKVKGYTLSGDVPWLLYQPEVEAKADAGAEAQGEGGSEAGEPGEPKAGEGAGAERGSGEEPARRSGRRGSRGRFGAGRTGGRPGFGGEGGASSGRAEPTDPLESKRPAGSELVIRDLVTGVERKLADVVAYGLSGKGRWFWYHTSQKQPAADSNHGLFVEQTAGGDPIRLLDGTVNVAGLTWTRDESALAFLSDKEDFAADKPQRDIWLWNGQRQPAQRIVFAGAPGMPEGGRIGSRLSFCRDGSVLQFDIEAAPADEPLPILPEDKVTLDLWNWRDGQLQTQQAKRRGGDREARTAVFHRDRSRLVVLGDERLSSMRFLGADGGRMLATDSEPYEKEVSWDGRYSDVWLVNSLDGSRQRLLEHYRGNTSNSPGGRYLLWMDDDFHWQAYDLASGVRRDLTGGLSVPFHDHDDDHPEPGRAYGIAGWTAGDAAVVLYDEFDLWQIEIKSGDAVCVTDGYGRANGLQLRLQRLPREGDDEESFYLDGELLLTALDTATMAEGVYRDALHEVRKPVRLFAVDKNLDGLTRPVASERFFFTLSTFEQFPDLWTANADFSGLRQLSEANPQQRDYRWGKAELVHWVDGDGRSCEGVLVKPDGFDRGRKYPMMVNFYEEMTRRLHSYSAPQPGTSPNAAYYVSNGYLWFMPDVHYEVGYPGASCVKCVVSGVQHLIAQGFVDADAIGAAGHSWGGYQTAFLVTRTNIFAAVESGAPVSNMISAYGGIRYGTGMSRQFQYEKTQSRIGGTPWQYPMRYWENSPIFFADKVQTPVLMLHNDNDGAVPWTQGIEYFTALRRLGKEAYLFNYNGEDHGLRQRQNQKDWTRRMSEYFAHHLEGKPAPQWMTEGVPYAERETEKLPFAPSYIEAYVKPAPTPVEAASEKPASEQPAVEKAAPAVIEAGLQKGDPAPDFTATDEAGNEHRLTSYRGRKVLLWFYPKAGTPG